MVHVIAMVALAVTSAAGDADLAFDRVKISDAPYEAASAFDVDNDGNMDIVSGAYWYAGPGFETKHKICDVAPQGEYYDDFGDFPMDVNGDGYTDIVTGGYWGGFLQWRENPKGQPVEWVTHNIAPTGSIERPCFYDMDGDGFPEVIPNDTKSLSIYKLVRDAQGKGTGEFKTFLVKDGSVGHGIGFGDVNADGRVDILATTGWFESPASGLGGEWVWHEEWNLGSMSVPTVMIDVNGDKLDDIIVGGAHAYGLDWWEQKKDADGKRSWVKHEIDPGRSQYHDMMLTDMDKDGDMELVTGKRYRAHNDGDPGAKDPIGVYYFEINGGEFKRVTLDYGPAETSSGIGIFCWVADVDKNGWPDVIAPGKDGLYLFKSKGK